VLPTPTIPTIPNHPSIPSITIHHHPSPSITIHHHPFQIPAKPSNQRNYHQRLATSNNTVKHTIYNLYQH
jgi:hypothetical protein